MGNFANIIVVLNNNIAEVKKRIMGRKLGQDVGKNDDMVDVLASANMAYSNH